MTRWQWRGAPCASSVPVLYLSRLRQNRHCHGAGVDAALLLCPRHSLHSVHPSFKFHVLVGFRASNAGWRMPKATLTTGRAESFLPFCHALFKLTITCILMKYSWKSRKLIIESTAHWKTLASLWYLVFQNIMSECCICKSYVCVTHVSQVHAESEGSIRSIRDDLWVVVSYHAAA